MKWLVASAALAAALICGNVEAQTVNARVVQSCSVAQSAPVGTPGQLTIDVNGNLCTSGSGGGGGGAVTSVDGGLATIGTTTDTSSANTLVGLLKAQNSGIAGASGTPTQTTVNVTTASTTILAAATATKFIKLCVASTAANGVWVNWAGATAVQAAPSEYVPPGQCDAWVKSTGFLPTSQINGIGSATVAVTLIYN